MSSAAVANLLPRPPSGLSPGASGVYVGDGMIPVLKKLADKICKRGFVKMEELLPEIVSVHSDEEGQEKRTAVA